MPFFAYKARNPRGEFVEGVVEATDSAALADQLFNVGITPIEIAAARNPAEQAAGGALARLFEEKISIVDLMLFSRQMYTLMKAGVPILRSLAGLQESTQKKKLKEVLRDLRESLDTGRELSTAMRRHPKVFSPFYVSMVRVGEMTGMLEEVFLRLFYYLEFEKDMRERIKSALRYPSFVIMAMAVAIVIINIFVIPAFSKVYESFHAELPWMTKMLIAFSNFMVQFWPMMMVALGASILGIRFYLSTRNGRYQWDKFKLRIPIIGKIIFKGTLARFARSFALSSKSGIPIVQGLSVVALVVDNAFIAERIEQMRDGVERGESILRTAVTAGILSPIVLQMLAVGEETGELDNLMQEVAEMYEREVEYEVKTMGAQIEPILIVSLGAMVLVLALGIFLPMWDLGKAAFHQ